MRPWTIRIVFFAAEFVLVFMAGALWLGVGDGSWPGLSVIADVLIDPGFALIVGVWAAGVVGLQGLFLFPVRRPIARRDAHMSVLMSLTVAGLASALLLADGAVAAVEVFTEWEEIAHRSAPWLSLLAALLTAWAAATPVLFVFSRGRQESVLGRVSAGLFLGTIIELVAIIPLDVMVRRRTDCYCATGTFLGLTTVGSVGLFSFGPAVLLPLLARRRRRWWSGHCDVCGYDMEGLRGAERCPECGAGWKPTPPT